MVLTKFIPVVYCTGFERSIWGEGEKVHGARRKASINDEEGEKTRATIDGRIMGKLSLPELRVPCLEVVTN